jgi:asparagine synthase (glutamine-hydrolysing)
LGGIAGLVHFSGEPPPLAQLHQLSAGIAHRGNDDKGMHSDGIACMAHRRHALRYGDQRGPLKSDETIIAVDGRFYAHSESNLLELWNENGVGMLERLNGVFAMAIWEKRKKTLYLLRGAVGARPLFWAGKAGKFAFCSELPPLLELPWVSRDLAMEHIAEQLSFRYVHAPRTLVRDIQAVPAGHYLRITSKEQTLESWRTPNWCPVDQEQPAELETVDRLDHLLRRSVERRLRGDGPTGVLLSGGLDSSAILHHACVHSSPPPTFTAVLEGGIQDESPFAARVAKMMGAENHGVPITTQELGDSFHEASRRMGQPLTTAAGAIQHLLFQKLRGSVKVLLSGDGGDEVLAGRSMPQLAWRMNQSRRISKLPYVGRRIARGIARRAGSKDLAASYENFGVERSIGASRIFLAPDRVDILSDPGLVRPGIRRTILTPFYSEVDSDPVNEILHVWQRGWLTEDSLARSDRMSASAGIEIRYPMLDLDFMNFCAQLPGRAKVKRKGMEHIAKWPLRESMRPHLPERLLLRPKRTLLHPLDAWLRGQGAPFLKERSEAVCSSLSHIFVPAMVRRLRKEHLEGRKNHGLRLWTLILFQLWWEQVQP